MEISQEDKVRVCRRLEAAQVQELNLCCVKPEIEFSLHLLNLNHGLLDLKSKGISEADHFLVSWR